MADKLSIARRWEEFQLSKTQVFWACAACVVGTLILGFNWGGWVTGGTARDMAEKASTGARAELAAAICVQEFSRGADVTAQFASLKGADSWARDTFIEKGGWVTLAGAEKPIAGAAILCVRQLMEPKPAKTAG